MPDIKIFFHDRNTDEKGILINVINASAVQETTFSNTKDSIFLIHGWHDNYNGTINRDVGQAYLKVVDVNIFVIDWSEIASKNYIEAFENITGIGQLIGKFIRNLIAAVGLRLSKTSIIGHSLGAHIAGVAGANLSGEAQFVIGKNYFILLLFIAF